MLDASSYLEFESGSNREFGKGESGVRLTMGGEEEIPRFTERREIAVQELYADSR